MIYLDWIQNRLVLDPMKSYTSLGSNPAELCRMTSYRSPTCLIAMDFNDDDDAEFNAAAGAILTITSTTAPTIAQSSIQTFNFLLYSIYRSFADSLPSGFWGLQGYKLKLRRPKHIYLIRIRLRGVWRSRILIYLSPARWQMRCIIRIRSTYTNWRE